MIGIDEDVHRWIVFSTEDFTAARVAVDSLFSAPLLEPTANSVKGIQLDDGSFDAGGCGLDKGSDESKR
jgi:hypothetical protein